MLSMHLNLCRARDLLPSTPSHGVSAAPTFEAAIPPGRLVELSGGGASARASCAARMIAHAQQQGETTAWISSACATVCPLDLRAHGIDLDALIFVRLPGTLPPHAPCRAAEIMGQSGAFGLIVLDLVHGPGTADSAAWTARLAGLARTHESLVVALTAAPSPATTSHHDAPASLGPLVAVHATPKRARNADGAHWIEHTFHKFKRHQVPVLERRTWRPPWGVQ